MTRRNNAAGLARELKKTRDGITGTLEWIKPRVQCDVYAKVESIARQAIRYGVMLNSLESQAFNAGQENELNES